MRLFMDTKREELVEAEVFASYEAMYPNGDLTFVPRALRWFTDWFTGKARGYLAIDVRYHDLEHTLQGLLCMVRILRRRHNLGHTPVVDKAMFKLGMLAMLMHDSGYLKKTGDSDGTGAKYTLVHVDRSVAFAADFMSGHGYSEREIRSVQNMIRCTGVNVKLSAIDFQSEAEKIVGSALGTADLLGQMAAPDYVDKLPILYAEFEEMARYSQSSGGANAFTSAEDLMRKTPVFWEKFVLPKLATEFGGLWTVLNDPYPDGPNPYLDAINANMTRLRRDLSQLVGA
jgi:hypothetical protein